MRSRSLPVLMAAGFLAGCGGSTDAPPASEREQSSVNSEVSTGPCYVETAPHAPQKVMAAFVTAGYEVTAECVDDETTIFILPGQAGGIVQIVCSIVPGPDPSDEYEGAVFAGNVACVADTAAERATTRTILDSL